MAVKEKVEFGFVERPDGQIGNGSEVLIIEQPVWPEMLRHQLSVGWAFGEQPAGPGADLVERGGAMPFSP